jgi:hypothetical protein
MAGLSPRFAIVDVLSITSIIAYLSRDPAQLSNVCFNAILSILSGSQLSGSAKASFVVVVAFDVARVQSK